MNKKLLYFLMSLAIPIAILIVCLLYKINIFSVEPANQLWNDEVFYFKQIQPVVHNGGPMGYFGYNYSHALVGGFGTWSPLLIYIYAPFMFLFEQSRYTVYFTNLIIMIITVFLFLILMNKNRKESLLLLIPILSCQIIRYSYSGLAEPLFFSAIILLYALYTKRENRKYRIIAFVIIFICTIIRPYFVVLFFVFIDKSTNFKKSINFIIICSLISILVFFGIGYFFTAPYLKSLLRIHLILEYLISGDLFSLLLYILSNGYNVIKFIVQGLLLGERRAILFTIYIFTTLLLMYNAFINYRRKSKDFSCTILTIVYIISFLIIINIYYVTESDRHLFLFSLFGLLYLIDHIACKIQIMLISLIILITNMLFFSYFENKWIDSDVNREYTNVDLSEIVITNQGYEGNTLVIEFEIDMNLYKSLYGVKSGIGLNLCMSEIVKNIDSNPYGYAMISTQSDNIKIYNLKWDVLIESEKFIIFKNPIFK